MLSPHEFSTLMLIKDAPDQVDLRRAELNVLLERQLVFLKNPATGHPCPHITDSGDSVLKAIQRM
ncbi:MULTISPECIES: hypothetical protein [Paraburkholderia]|uniref:hypothetical protein n=1 Tax=Paraburkholderia TaxID=1822464 RepID=UPI002258566B|nr:MULTISPECIES: hypothetical protein [Paraburkholderia]MCX4159809.1 hypothetical protein [Paraburkholderia aspalathi]MDN7169206.1 hypothetical protein [Paraburkholderia sp. SECH2]MDQ6397694.1 hypothetical protein [Paraburkholderia aspalathi]